MGMLYDIKLPKISCHTINIHLCDRTVSTIDLCHRSHFTIRVGFFEMDGYHMQDETGKRSGYGYDTLRLMARYWNVRFEYIGYDKSCGNMQKMLEDNEIDIGTSTHKTPDLEKKFDFSRLIGSNECMITVRNDNTSFVVQDYTTYNMHDFLSASK